MSLGPADPLTINFEESPYEAAHPSIADSVMNYDREHDCSPHPFDILAIYALYQ